MNTKDPWKYILMIALLATFAGTIYYFFQEESPGKTKSLEEIAAKFETEKGLESTGASTAKTPMASAPIPQKQPSPGPQNPPLGMENARDEGTLKADANPESPAPEKPEAEEEKILKFAVIGDTQRFKKDDLEGSLQKAVKNIQSFAPEMILSLGDLVSECDEKEECEEKLGSWKTAVSDLFSKIYPTMGNHDRSGEETADAVWQGFFDLPTNGPEGFSELVYSFDKENCHFAVLNSAKPEEGIVNKVQRDWLEKDLKDSKKDNIFVAFHEPAYPVSEKKGDSLDKNKEERDALWKILKDNEVAAVFSGHEHIASRKKIGDIHQFIFGNTDSFNHDLPKEGEADWSYKGDHYATVEVQGKKITVKTYSVEGNALDSFEFENGK